MTIPEVAAALAIPAQHRLHAAPQRAGRLRARAGEPTSHDRRQARSGRGARAGAPRLVARRGPTPARVRRAIGAALAAGAAAGEAQRRPARRRSAQRRLGPRGCSSRARSPRRAEAPGTGPVTARVCARHAPAAPVVSLGSAAAAAEPKPAPSRRHPLPRRRRCAMPSLVPSRHDAHGARRGSESRAPSQTESLAIEVRALRNAERALRDGNPGLALAFLQELDRQVPNGQLTEERDAASTLARCARGDHPFGVNLAARVHRAPPRKRLPRARRAGLRRNGFARARRLIAEEVRTMKNERTRLLRGSPVRRRGPARLLGRRGGQHRQHADASAPSSRTTRRPGTATRRRTPSGRTARITSG